MGVTLTRIRAAIRAPFADAELRLLLTAASTMAAPAQAWMDAGARAGDLGAVPDQEPAQDRAAALAALLRAALTADREPRTPGSDASGPAAPAPLP